MSGRAAFAATSLPIFPLTGVLLLPRGRLPLNIFEPRYLAMTRDALAGERLIGMVQPRTAHADAANPPVYPHRLRRPHHQLRETEDGRYPDHADRRLALPHPRGIAARQRLSPRRARLAALRAATSTATAEPGFDRERLVRGAAAAISRRHSITPTGRRSSRRRASGWSPRSPWSARSTPSEKQALLEAPDLAERAPLLTALVEMAVLGGEPATTPARATDHARAAEDTMASTPRYRSEAAGDPGLPADQGAAAL